MNKSLVKFNWVIESDFRYPKDSRFFCTGYTGENKADNLFSIVVELVNFDGDARNATEAEIRALSEDMEDFLPKKGEKFFITSGAKIVAEGLSLERTF
ncbi:hypothetical protein [Gayadomonas joobiniege]|uniref:hypothetical protein n=1 Tax=Gayadomonas joobiniege TaxID=1234606 RepID=UPI000374EA30|nr:hypothetical protein [Gayadomonas joobiniege]